MGIIGSGRKGWDSAGTESRSLRFIEEVPDKRGRDRESEIKHPLEPLGIQSVVLADNKVTRTVGGRQTSRKRRPRKLDSNTTRGGSLSYLLLS